MQPHPCGTLSQRYTDLPLLGSCHSHTVCGKQLFQIAKLVMMPTKVHLVKATVFPVVVYGYESWTIKKAECWRIDAFVLWCWRRLLRVPWTARRNNQSVLKEISPRCSLEGLMLKLKLQGPPDGESWLIWKDPDTGKDWRWEEKRTTEDEMVGWHHQLNEQGFGWTLGVGDGWGGLECCGSWGHRVRHDWATELTELPISPWQVTQSPEHQMSLSANGTININYSKSVARFKWTQVCSILRKAWGI